MLARPPLAPRRAAALLVALVVAAAVAAVAAVAAPAAHARTVWLCNPALRADPCRPSLSTTRLSPAGRVLGTQTPRRARVPRVDCFYVYPTVSNQPRPQATLRIDPELRSIALYQAARYSQSCRVFAPVYRQVTIQGLGAPATVTPAMRERAYHDVRAAWRAYLRRDNHGRGVVFLSHSQGTFVLRRLLAAEVDRRPAVRRRLVSAVLLGGNVVVARGRETGGDFRHIRACRAATQVGCVIAFSTFDAPPPADALFGRTTVQRFGLPAAPRGTAVLCTNPAALRGGSGHVTPVYPTAPFAPGTAIGVATTLVGFPVPPVRTAWVAAPGSYVAHCTPGAAHVLLVAPVGGAPDLNAVPDATWGLHLADANIALGQLTSIVRTQATAWLAREAALQAAPAPTFTG